LECNNAKSAQENKKALVLTMQTQGEGRMASTKSGELKNILKKLFPFLKYRWRVYEISLPMYESIKKATAFIYFRVLEMYGQRDLSQGKPLLEGKKLEIQAVDESNREGLVEFAENNPNTNMYKNWARLYIKNNYNGYIALLQGKIIGYLWWWAPNKLISPPPEMVFYNIELKEREVYMFNMFVAPQYRGGGNAIEFLSHVLKALIKRGYTITKGVHGANYLPARITYMAVGYAYKEIKCLVRHTFFRRIVLMESAFFVKNSPRHAKYPCEFRLLFSFRSKSIKTEPGNL
jgi:GNAT superfamily N-acetyltransferase